MSCFLVAGRLRDRLTKWCPAGESVPRRISGGQGEIVEMRLAEWLALAAVVGVVLGSAADN